MRNVYYAYDARGQQTAARFDSASGTDAVVNAYDGFGRLTSSTVSMGGISRTVGRQYDADGNRIRVTHPDSNYFTYDYDGLDRMSAIKQNGATQVGSYDFDWKGQRWHAARGAVLTTYGYDAVSRLNSLADDLAGTNADVTSIFGYNYASQITSVGRNNDSYVYAAYLPETKGYAVNGLNQYTAVNGVGLGYDSNGNLASNGGTSFTYDVENRLVSATGSLATAMVYDPLGRLFQTSSAAAVRQFLYDGDERIAEYDGGSGALLRRYVHGPGDDGPQLWYEGSGLTDRRSLQANHQGSIVSVTDASGAALAIRGYDEYGVASGGDVGAFQYTGQAWLPDLGMYYYKARVYSARLGRFLRVDPVGYEDEINFYSYVGNDPFNAVDSSGKRILYNDPKMPNSKETVIQKAMREMAGTGGGEWRDKFEKMNASDKVLNINSIITEEIGITYTSVDDASNGKGTDVNAYINLNGSVVEGVGPGGKDLVENLKDILSHEIFDHAFKAMMGILNDSADIDPTSIEKTGTASLAEQEGTATENRWRKQNNEEERKRYTK